MMRTDERDRFIGVRRAARNRHVLDIRLQAIALSDKIRKRLSRSVLAVGDDQARPFHIIDISRFIGRGTAAHALKLAAQLAGLHHALGVSIESDA